MITIDSASGNIQMPKIFDYEDLFDNIKTLFSIDDELFKYLYFSYIDEKEQERIRLNPQIFDDFIRQESPKLSIGFLDNVDENIIDEFKDIIDSNKKRFEKINFIIPYDYLVLHNNNINDEINKQKEFEINIEKENDSNKEKEIEIQIKKDDDIIEEKEAENQMEKKNDIKDNQINENQMEQKDDDDEENKIYEIQIEKKEDDEENKINEINEIQLEKKDDDEENKINDIKMEIENDVEENQINEIKIEKENDIEQNDIQIEKKKDIEQNQINEIQMEKKDDIDQNQMNEIKVVDEQIILENVNINNEINIEINNKEENFSLLNSGEINNANNNIIDINKKDSNNFQNIDNSELNLIKFEQNAEDNFNFDEKKVEENEDDEFNKNIENIINSNIENIKEEIIQSILVENSKIQQKSKMKKTIPKNSYIHENYVCDFCNASPIKGIRYHCLECKNFDLCENCEETIGHEHPLYKIKNDKLCKFKNEITN